MIPMATPFSQVLLPAEQHATSARSQAAEPYANATGWGMQRLQDSAPAAAASRQTAIAGGLPQ